MAKTNHRDLPEFGLPLVGPESATFSTLVRDIEARPQPFGSWPTGDLNTAAVLLNQSGKAIVILAYIWRYTTAEGKTRTSRCSNLVSSMQMDFLSGQAEVIRDLGSFILPGSKRLITERGMFGNNLDVLPPEADGRAEGVTWALVEVGPSAKGQARRRLRRSSWCWILPYLRMVTASALTSRNCSRA